MVNLDNHNNHSHCNYYIYLTLGVNERKGFLYVGQHKCKSKGEFDDNYFGSGFHIKRIEKKYGKDYVRDNFRTIPIWWCETKEQADQMETFFTAEYETKELGMNIADGGEGCYTIERRQQYYNDKFCNSEFVAYTEEEMDGFYKEENKAYNKAYREQNKEELKAKNKAYYEQHKEEAKSQNKAYYEQNKEEIKEKSKAYYEQNKEEIKAYREQHKEEIKAYKEQHKEEIKAYKKAYKEQHKEEIKAYYKAYYEQNKEELKARRRAKYLERKKLLNNNTQ